LSRLRRLLQFLLQAADDVSSGQINAEKDVLVPVKFGFWVLPLT
jgi:hypothetical protein